MYIVCARVFYTAFCLYVCIFFLCATILVNKYVYNDASYNRLSYTVAQKCYPFYFIVVSTSVVQFLE